MAARKSAATTGASNGARSRSVKGVPESSLFRLVNLRTTTGQRRYLDPVTGETFSERQVSNARAGGVSKERAQFQRRAARAVGRVGGTVRRPEDFETQLRDYQTAEFLRTGKRPSLKRLRKAGTPENRAFNKVVRDLASSDEKRKRRALVRLGRRPENARWKVGDSPSKVSFAEFQAGPFFAPNYRPAPERRKRKSRAKSSKRARVTGRN